MAPVAIDGKALVALFKAEDDFSGQTMFLAGSVRQFYVDWLRPFNLAKDKPRLIGWGTAPYALALPPGTNRGGASVAAIALAAIALGETR